MTELNILSPILSSTVVLLGGGAVFTGGSFSTMGYGKIVGSVYSDVSGTLYVEQSNDDVNWDGQQTVPYLGLSSAGYEVRVVKERARIRYVNGGVAQAAFRADARLRRE